ncbi:MAG: ABC transporter ATP-binding protein [Desulfobacteraceae bacterium]|nr:ABC transporter ATP-binding protein [Desulfobacteraceae bacterium]
MTNILIKSENIRKSYKINKKETVRAIDGFNLEIRNSEIMGLLGASGSGKTTLARILTGLETADAGKIFFENAELTSLAPVKRRKFCRDIQMIFQDPFSSMSPRLRVCDIVAEPLRIQKYPKPYTEMVSNMLRQAGISEDFLQKYPFELSGGEKQRVAVARTFILKPKFVVADEIVSMLDSTHKLEILDLILKLRNETGLSVLFITHDIAVAGYVCDRIAVMENGRIVEVGETDRILRCPEDPYTIELIEAVPRFIST